MKLRNLPLNLLKIIEGKKMIEAIQNTAGLFALLASGFIMYDRDREYFSDDFAFIIAITLWVSLLVVFVTSLIRIWA